MLNPARSTHCNGTSDGKSEGNQARPSLNGPVSVLDRYNPKIWASLARRAKANR